MTTAQRRFRYGVGASLAILALQTVWLRVRIGGEFATTAFSDLHTAVICPVVALACWRVARRARGRMRRSWMLLGLAILSWGIGEAVWSWYELVERVEVPFPSLADVGYLAFIPLAAAAMLSFPTAPARATSKVRTVVDGLVVTTAVFYVSWALVLGDAFRASEGTLLEQALGLAYPIGDLVTIIVVAYAAVRARGSHRRAALLIGAGLTAIALADSGFLYLTQHDAYRSGNLVDLGWTAGFLLVGVAALGFRSGRSVSDEFERPSIVRALLPLAAVAAAAPVSVYEQVSTGRLEGVLFWTALVAILLIAARQALTSLENLALTRNLEDKVRARTTDLERAFDQLAESRRLQDAFVASVSHELRTPLTSIFGATSTLLRPEMALDGTGRSLAEIAHRGAQRMSRQVEDLLIASALVDGIECARSPVNLSVEVRSTLSDFAPSGKTVEVDVPPMVIGVGDAARIRVILGHLLTNADKFAPAGTTIRVEAARAGDHVDLVVRDQGQGVPDALRARIFDRFVQADMTPTRRHQGTGLGLYIARRLAEAMGGTLSLDAVGVGAAFRLRLPAAAFRAQGVAG